MEEAVIERCGRTPICLLSPLRLQLELANKKVLVYELELELVYGLELELVYEQGHVRVVL